jgi:hypothetical protein
MIISGGYIECFARITDTNYYENQTHRWDLGPSMEPIDTSGIHKIPYTWTVTGGGANSSQSWNIYGTNRNITQLYFQTLLAGNTITLSRYSSQFSAPHGTTGAGINGAALELDYLPSELQWSSTYGATSFAGGQWRVLYIPQFSFLGGGRILRGVSRTIAFPLTPGATETNTIVPFYGNGAGSPSDRTCTARWYWEIDF